MLSSPTAVDAFLNSFRSGPGAAPATPPGMPDGLPAVTDLQASLSRMTALTDPFPCGLIDDFLPDDLYQALLRDWPGSEEFDHVSKVADVAAAPYLGTRKERIVENWAADAAEHRSTWNRISAALKNPNFVESLFARFSGTVEQNLTLLDYGPQSRASFKLYANVDAGAKEALGAHIDALPKLLTIVIYLDLQGDTDSTSPSRWGTALYQPGGAVAPLSFSRNAEHEIAHQVDFVPNRAFVMPNTARSLHGVAGGQAGVTRRTLMCGYWLLKDTSRVPV